MFRVLAPARQPCTAMSCPDVPQKSLVHLGIFGLATKRKLSAAVAVVPSSGLILVSKSASNTPGQSSKLGLEKITGISDCKND